MAFAALFADSLFCSEERLDDLFQEPAQDDDWSEPPALDDELPALFEAYRCKEEPLTEHGGNAGREAAVGWATRAAARLGFSALTAALATAYLDRCFLGGGAMRLRAPSTPDQRRRPPSARSQRRRPSSSPDRRRRPLAARSRWRRHSDHACASRRRRAPSTLDRRHQPLLACSCRHQHYAMRVPAAAAYPNLPARSFRGCFGDRESEW
ncbi:hypothetical protein QYE76_036168 [Lolium multiflorum]|uniref:Uncharacterized protein n=1 Tax=Lolium multiflorum TaxID=4521 RepID=A0AAD8R0F9_LOLMU|nr:hypothetical protein QYE76_036168 [Lolium multiflorum]